MFGSSSDVNQGTTVGGQRAGRGQSPRSSDLDIRDFALYIGFVAPEICPHCGSEVPPKAKACPGCGSDERTGWSEEARAAGLDLPDEGFDYGDFVEREFGASRRARPRGIPWFWWLVAIGVAGAFLAFWLF
jgi:hypothetical protein